MKRIFFGLFLFFCFSFLFRTNAAAYKDCVTQESTGYTFCTGSAPFECPIPGLVHCCKDNAACQAALVTPTPKPNPGDPTPWVNPCIKPGDPDGYKKLPTAIGCIDYTNTSGLTKSLLTFALGVGGGIAFLLMIIGSFMIMTSSGNPERQQAGKEMITSAIMGLLLILLSVFILQLIGVKILAIPGFG
jgi:hypothetical protein